MYAVILSGGKQYRVAAGEAINLDKIELEPGAEVVFDKVMLVSDGQKVEIGAPFVEGKKVVAKIVSHGRGEKVKILKFKRRKHQMKRQGHRQWFTRVVIEKVA